MLKLDQEYFFTAPATIKIAALADKGLTFNVELRLLPSDEVEAMQAEINAGTKTGLDFARRVLVGWPEGEVRDADGVPLYPTQENRERLLRQPGAGSAVISAFWSGYWPATEGNSEPPSAG